jgi:hypothetical protein
MALVRCASCGQWVNESAIAAARNCPLCQHPIRGTVATADQVPPIKTPAAARAGRPATDTSAAAPAPLFAPTQTESKPSPTEQALLAAKDALFSPLGVLLTVGAFAYFGVVISWADASEFALVLGIVLLLIAGLLAIAREARKDR